MNLALLLYKLSQLKVFMVLESDPQTGPQWCILLCLHRLSVKLVELDIASEVFICGSTSRKVTYINIKLVSKGAYA